MAGFIDSHAKKRRASAHFRGDAEIIQTRKNSDATITKYDELKAGEKIASLFFRYTENSININTLMDKRTLHEFNVRLSGKNSLIQIVSVQCMWTWKLHHVSEQNIILVTRGEVYVTSHISRLELSVLIKILEKLNDELNSFWQINYKSDVTLVHSPPSSSPINFAPRLISEKENNSIIKPNGTWSVLFSSSSHHSTKKEP